MATGMTFASLKADISNYLERGNVTDTTVYDQIPRLITLAEENISRELKIQGYITTVTSNLTSGKSVYAKPSRWRETVSMFYGSGTTRNPIFPRSYEYCRMYAPNSASLAAPKFYADYQYNYWLLAPTPDTNYNFEVSYYAMPALLDEANSTNWLTDYAPQLILYRALMETALFLRDNESAGTFEGLYGKALSALSNEDLQKIVDRTSTRQEA